MQDEIYIGLMSGTSLDAVDAIAIQFPSETGINVLGEHTQPIPDTLKNAILELCAPGSNEVHRLGRLDIELGNLFARCVMELVQRCKLNAADITAIGSHGQTIRHMPNETTPFTIQIGDPNIITKVTGITTVADFRRRDMAYGGQAAPLAPAFHQYLFQSEESSRFIVNIGGIANLTFLPTNKKVPVIGFDTGPGNTLIDAWCLKHTNQPFDKNGEWASQGRVSNALLAKLLEEDFFNQAPPKSTGREFFNLTWLANHLENLNETPSPVDIQATLTELTASSIATSILSVDAKPPQIYFCGGGAFNGYLLSRIQTHLPHSVLSTTQELGLDPLSVEAATFAWLARQTLKHQPGNLPSVTGASQHTILGAIYPSSTH